MAINTVKPDLVRYEMRVVQGQNPNEKEQKRPGAFGRFLSGVGKVLGAVAMPLSFLFPPAAIGAAGMYGMGQIGDGMQRRAYERAAEKQSRDQMTNISCPGLGMDGSSDIRPAAGSFAAGDQAVMNVLEVRGNSISSMAQRI